MLFVDVPVVVTKHTKIKPREVLSKVEHTNYQASICYELEQEKCAAKNALKLSSEQAQGMVCLIAES